MKYYDKFLYCYFKLKKKEDIYSVFFLSLIQYVNILSIVIIIDMILGVRVLVNNLQFLLFIPSPLLMFFNLFYLLWKKKFQKLFDTYRSVDNNRIIKGKLFVVAYMVFSVIFFTVIGVISSKFFI